MRRTLLLAAATLYALPVLASPGPPRTRRLGGENVIFHAQLHEHDSYSDVWGYTAPNGREYALLGAYDGTAIVDITERRGSREVAFVPGPPSRWREIKTYGSWAYVVTEGGGGLQIISLADPAHPAVVTPNWHGFDRAHNLYIDEAAGMAFIAGRDAPPGEYGGVMILRLVTPTSPLVLGTWDAAYAHDVYAREGRMYVSAIYQGRLYILDIANPGTPLIRGVIANYPDAFTHNAWPTDDGNYVLTTDERSGAFVRMWDIHDVANPVQAGAYRPPDGIRTSPHNVLVEGSLAYVSWYTMGVIILDLSEPADLHEAGRFDSHPESNSPTFEGCWGVFPFYPNSPGLFVASDIYRGLFVLQLEDQVVLAARRDAARSTEGAPGVDAAPAPLRLSSPFPNPGADRGVRFEVATARPTSVAVDILDTGGRRVRFLGERSVPAGRSLLTWDGRDGAGRRVAAGAYLVRVTGGGSTAARKVVVSR